MKMNMTKDIDPKPGVSMSTVFTTLSGLERIIQDARPRVYPPAREPKCHPGTLTQCLRRNQTQAIGVAIPRLKVGLTVLKSL
jgi:DNA-binding LacI/PurR family transcriptional regulator